MVKVPRISAFYGIVIEMHFRDHPPPHFHAKYADQTAKVDIATGEVIAGSLPTRALRLVREWRREHRRELDRNWVRTQLHEPPESIPPLQ
jgi:Domain of unknown function (DUF4160)